VKKHLVLILLAALAACAAQEETVTQDAEQAIRDFIAVHQLAETEQVRTANDDSWTEIDKKFVLYEARNEVFLFEFSRRCHELDELPVVPDTRHSGNAVRARFDTLRGCRIARIFLLTEGEVAELSNIGASPGSRN
jgi:hypothetical protein